MSECIVTHWHHNPLFYNLFRIAIKMMRVRYVRIYMAMNGKTLCLLTSAKLLISFGTHLHSLKFFSSNNLNDGSNLFLNVNLERQHFHKLFLHLKLINFKLLMSPMLLFFKNTSLKIMNIVIFGSFHPF